MQAYILISVEKSKEQKVYDALEDLKEVLGVNVIFGEWDMITKVNIENAEDLGTFILDKLRTIDGVKLTSALIVAK